MHQLATRRHSFDRAPLPPPPTYVDNEGMQYDYRYDERDRYYDQAPARRGSHDMTAMSASKRDSYTEMPMMRRAASHEGHPTLGYRRMSDDGLLDELLHRHREEQYQARLREFERDRMLDELLKRKMQLTASPAHLSPATSPGLGYSASPSGLNGQYEDGGIVLSRHPSKESLAITHAETVRGSEVEVDLSKHKHSTEMYHVHLKNGRECEACKQVWLDKQERMKKLEKQRAERERAREVREAREAAREASPQRVPMVYKGVVNPDNPKPLPKPDRAASRLQVKPTSRPKVVRRSPVGSSVRSQTAAVLSSTSSPAATAQFPSPKRSSPRSVGVSSKSTTSTGRIRTWRENTAVQKAPAPAVSLQPKKLIVRRSVIAAPNIKA